MNTADDGCTSLVAPHFSQQFLTAGEVVSLTALEFGVLRASIDQASPRNASPGGRSFAGPLFPEEFDSIVMIPSCDLIDDPCDLSEWTLRSFWST